MSENQGNSINISGQSYKDFLLTKNVQDKLDPKTRKKDLKGQRFGRLLVIEEAGRNRSGNIKWKCVCDCGKETTTVGSTLINGEAKSCGCIATERIKETNKKHGLWKHPLFGTWSSLIDRCTNKNNQFYGDYGGRGVVICDKWRTDFKVFYDWCLANGWKKGLEIDKDIKAKELGVEALLYSPERCQFVTKKINCRNRRNNTYITVRGKTATIAEFSEIYNVKAYNISQRMIRLGWTAEEAIFGRNKNK